MQKSSKSMLPECFSYEFASLDTVDKYSLKYEWYNGIAVKGKSNIYGSFYSLMVYSIQVP